MTLHRDTIRTAVLVIAVGLCTLVVWWKLDRMEASLTQLDDDMGQLKQPL